MHKYEIWLHNYDEHSVSIFIDEKEHIYEIPESANRMFEIYLNCGIVMRYIGKYAGVLNTAKEAPVVYRDGDMEWIEFESELPLEWVVIIPTESMDVCAGMVD